MVQLIPGQAGTKYAVSQIIDDASIAGVIGDFSSALSIGGVREVTFTWTSVITYTLDGNSRTMAPGSLKINAADVVAPTTYYIYMEGTSGTDIITSSILSPATNPAVDEYFILAVIRFKSVAGVLTVYFNKLPSQDGVYELVHNLKEDVLYFNPIWLSGCALTMSAGGKISTTSGYVRFPGNEPRTQGAVTEGVIALDNETTVAGIDGILTYADGSAITAGKWQKLLVGVIRNRATFNTTEYVVMRQGKPLVEYATASAAGIDAENVAAVTFPTAYLSTITPLYYLVTQVGDYTAVGFQAIDIRTSGIVRGGAGTSVTSHTSLADLTNFDDHTQYIPASGARGLTGAWDAGTFEIRALKFKSDQATGTAPFAVDSTTVVTNLNADQVDGIHASSFETVNTCVKLGGTTPLTANWDAGSFQIQAETLKSDVATGTAPLVIASETMVDNLNADLLDGNDATAFAVAAKGVTNGDTHDHFGGDGAQIDHGNLAGLADDDHTQYLLADGTRTLTNNLAVTALKTIDGVDISAHAADANAHHNAVTLNTAADGVLGLSTQQITLDTQSANTILAGPTTGVAATPTFRTIDHTDVSDFVATVNSNAPNVTLATSADTLLGLSTQQISLDTQAPNMVLSGPATGSTSAVPTFRSLTYVDMSDFDSRVNYIRPQITLDASTTSILDVSGTYGHTLGLDVQEEHKVLAGPTANPAAAPTFRQLAAADISDFNAAALLAAPAVTLDASADVLLSVSGQALGFDTQTASRVLAGPVVGSAAAVPTFRQLNIQDVARPSGTLTLANGLNNDIALTAGTRVYTITGPTAAFTLTGFSGGTDGTVLYLYNSTAERMTIAHQRISSTTAADRIITNTSGDLQTATDGVGMAVLVYIAGTLNRWVLMSWLA